MRRAMATAEVGDEQQRTDPTVNRLCDRVAQMLGHEAGLFLPTGTMCNLVAVATHTSPGDAIVASVDSHIVRSETGGAAAYSGVITDLVAERRGPVRPGGRRRGAGARQHLPALGPAALCLEQTHNFGGGHRVAAGAVPGRRRRGAREVACRCTPTGRACSTPRWRRAPRRPTGVGPVESIWVDFTKGLGAPIGAVLVGRQRLHRGGAGAQAPLRGSHAAGRHRRRRLPPRPRPPHRAPRRRPRQRGPAGRGAREPGTRAPRTRRDQHGVDRRGPDRPATQRRSSSASPPTTSA